jgi:hypothetical protein
MAGRKIKCPKCGGALSIVAGKTSPPRDEKAAVTRQPKEAAPVPVPKRREDSVTRPPRQAAPAAESQSAEKGYDDLEIVRAASDASAKTWETSELGQRPRLLVTRASIFRLSGLVYRDFNILDPQTKERVGVASDNPGMLVQCLRCLSFGRFSLREFLPTNLEIRETENGPLLFRIRRSPQVFQFSVTVEIYDGASRLLGYFQSKIFSLFGGFWVHDAEDAKVAELKFQMGMPPKMTFVTSEGTALGSVYPEGAREAIEQGKVSVVTTLGRSPGLDLKVSERMKDDPTARLLMLAAVLAMQFSGIGGRFQMKKM